MRRFLGDHASLFLLLLAVVVAGCRSVPSEGVHPHEEALTDEQIASARVEGERLWQVDPRSLITAESSLDWFRSIARGRPDDYEACWKGARAAAWIAARESGDDERKKFALEGIELGNSAVASNAAEVEGHVWLAFAMGELADVDHAYGLDAVKKMEEHCLAAIAADERYDHASAHRLVGTLYFMCPGPPTSIGSPRNAKKHLERALELDPAWPENHLWMGEFARDQGDTARAREELGWVLTAAAPKGCRTEAREWASKAKDELAK